MDVEEKLKLCFDCAMPGIKGQLAMAPKHRKSEIQDRERYAHAVKSSVLILFYLKNNEYYIPFIKRPLYDGVHSGQIAFPGGRWEKTDKSLYHTALREAMEEIGIHIHQVKLKGKLTDLFIPPSNYIVSPFVGTYQYTQPFRPDPAEVDDILEIPVSFFLDDKVVKYKEIQLARGGIIHTPCFEFEGHTIWGATAMILSELLILWKSTG